eukprot:gb/GFBE01057692.1/.p1 GENE.gb/GFBE01057692.1/~~gb/GFBE01057692.1/.p1  ORF type:complete len:293 (+),score=48.33 gb/GFBE01057692.1/:1-879(+)
MGNAQNPCCGSRWHAGVGDSSIFVGQRVCAERPSDSDHNAILFTLARDGGESLKLLTWNILCKYGYNEQWGFPFDGFNRHFESESDYLERLTRTASEIEALVEMHAPHAVLLQEGPEEDESGHGTLWQEVATRLMPHGFKVLQHGEFLTAVRGNCVSLDLPELKRQSGKIHAVHCSDLNCIILNVHFNWDKKKSENALGTRKDLEKILSFVHMVHTTAEVVLVGDTNRVLSEGPCTDPDAEVIEQLSEGLGSLCLPPGPTNVRWSGDKGKSEMTYADFALKCYPIQPVVAHF